MLGNIYLGKRDVNSSRKELLAVLDKWPHTRLPVYERNRNSIIGSVNIYEALGSGEDFQDIRKFIKPISRLNSATSVIDAMNEMIKQNDKIVLVVAAAAAKRKIIGIVTMKDLAEELTGELAEW